MRKTGRCIQYEEEKISKKILLGNAFFDEGPALGDAEFLLICLPVAVGAPGRFLFELLAPLPVPHVQDGGPLFDRHPSFHAPFIRTLLSSLRLPVGHAFADKFGQVSARDIFMRRLLRAHLVVLLAQFPLAHGRRCRRLGNAAIAGYQQHGE
jgi:hypothetical protein